MRRLRVVLGILCFSVVFQGSPLARAEELDDLEGAPTAEVWSPETNDGLGAVEPLVPESIELQGASHAEIEEIDWQAAKAKILDLLEPKGEFSWAFLEFRDFVLNVDGLMGKAPQGRYTSSLVASTAALKSGDVEQLKAWILNAPTYLQADRSTWDALQAHRERIRRAKASLLQQMGQPVTDAVVDLPLLVFVYRVRDLAGAKYVQFKAAADKAITAGTDAELENFIVRTGVEAWITDLEDMQKEKDAAEKWEKKKKQVWLLCGLNVNDFPGGTNDLVFVRLFIQGCEKSPAAGFYPGLILEAKGALESEAGLKTFIDTGAVAAAQADDKKNAEAQHAKAVAALREKIEIWKGQLVRPRLVAAALKMVETGTTTQIISFTTNSGNDRELLRQSFHNIFPVDTMDSDPAGQVFTPHWGDYAGPVIDAYSSWEVEDGLAAVSGRSCVTLKRVGDEKDPRWLTHASSTSVKAVPVSSDAMRKKATWCVSAAGNAVRFESAAEPGKFIHLSTTGAIIDLADASDKANWYVKDPYAKVPTPNIVRWYRDAAVRAAMGAFNNEKFDPKKVTVITTFHKGKMYYSKGTGSHFVPSEMTAKLDQYGLLASSDPAAGPQGLQTVKTTGWPVLWEPKHGAHAIGQGILDAWQQPQHEWLDLPISDEIINTDGVTRTEFEKGVLFRC